MPDEPLVLEDEVLAPLEAAPLDDGVDVLAVDPLAADDEDDALPEESLAPAFDDAVSDFLPLSAGTEL